MRFRTSAVQRPDLLVVTRRNSAGAGACNRTRGGPLSNHGILTPAYWLSKHVFNKMR